MTVSANPITEIDIDAYRGDTFSRVMVINADLTGYALRMQVRATEDSTKILSDVYTGNGITVNEITANSTTVTVSMSNAVTQKYPAGDLQYDLQTEQGGVIRTILRGAFNVTGDITR